MAKSSKADPVPMNAQATPVSDLGDATGIGNPAPPLPPTHVLQQSAEDRAAEGEPFTIINRALADAAVRKD